MISKKILLIGSILVILFAFYYFFIKSTNLDKMHRKIFPFYISDMILLPNLKLEKNYDRIINSVPRNLSTTELDFLLKYKKFVDSPNTYSMCESKDIDQIKILLENVIRNNIPGCIVETGIWKGGMAMWIKAILMYHNNNRNIYLYDIFGKFPPPSNSKDNYIHSITDILFEHAPTVTDVQNNFHKFGLLDSDIKFVIGDIINTVPQNQLDQIALLHCDSDYYESTKVVLENFYWKISKGGYIIIDDYNNEFLACKQAVDEFRTKYNICTPIIKISGASVYWEI